MAAAPVTAPVVVATPAPAPAPAVPTSSQLAQQAAAIRANKVTPPAATIPKPQARGRAKGNTGGVLGQTTSITRSQSRGLTPEGQRILARPENIRLVTGIKSASDFVNADNRDQQYFLKNAQIGSATYPVKKVSGTPATEQEIDLAGKSRTRLYPDILNAVEKWLQDNPIPPAVPASSSLQSTPVKNKRSAIASPGGSATKGFVDPYSITSKRQV